MSPTRKFAKSICIWQWFFSERCTYCALCTVHCTIQCTFCIRHSQVFFPLFIAMHVVSKMYDCTLEMCKWLTISTECNGNRNRTAHHGPESNWWINLARNIQRLFFTKTQQKRTHLKLESTIRWTVIVFSHGPHHSPHMKKQNGCIFFSIVYESLFERLLVLCPCAG